MTWLFAAFVTTLLVGIGGRDQVLIAALSGKLGKRLSLLVAAFISTAVTVAAATWSAAWAVRAVSAGIATQLGLLAIVLAGLQMAVVREIRLPVEPTRSLGAITLAFLLLQIVDPVRLFAMGLGCVYPDRLSAIGVTLGSAVAVTAGWLAGARLPVDRLLRLRTGTGLGLIALAGIAWLLA